MPKIIVDRAMVEDRWQLVRLVDDGALPDIPANADVIVPLKSWLAQRDALLARNGKLGVWLAPNDDPALIAADLGAFNVIAVDFPQYTDGRGYSIGRLLRERYKYSGELRAIGDIMKDQVFYLHRVGFNAFAVREDKDVEMALTALNDFSETYQASVEQPLPLFRRR